MNFTYLRDEDERHTQEAAKHNREWYERERRVLLTRDHQRYRSGDEAQHHDVVDTHSYVSGVVDGPHFNGASLIGEE